MMGLYGDVLRAESLEEVKDKLKMMLSEEETAYVEKIVAEEKQRKGRA